MSAAPSTELHAAADPSHSLLSSLGLFPKTPPRGRFATAGQGRSRRSRAAACGGPLRRRTRKRHVLSCLLPFRRPLLAADPAPARCLTSIARIGLETPTRPAKLAS